MVGCGKSASLSGKVMGNLALGIHIAKQHIGDCIRAAAACVPGFQDALTCSAQGMVTGLPVSSTTIVCGLAAATLRDQIVLMLGKA